MVLHITLFHESVVSDDHVLTYYMRPYLSVSPEWEMNAVYLETKGLKSHVRDQMSVGGFMELFCRTPPHAVAIQVKKLTVVII